METTEGLNTYKSVEKPLGGVPLKNQQPASQKTLWCGTTLAGTPPPLPASPLYPLICLTSIYFGCLPDMCKSWSMVRQVECQLNAAPPSWPVWLSNNVTAVPRSSVLVSLTRHAPMTSLSHHKCRCDKSKLLPYLGGSLHHLTNKRKTDLLFKAVQLLDEKTPASDEETLSVICDWKTGEI